MRLIGMTGCTVMSAQTNEYGSIDLGRGFRGKEGPADIGKEAADALMHDRTQYRPRWRKSQDLVKPWPPVSACRRLDGGHLAPRRRGRFEPLHDTHVPVVRMLIATLRFVRLAAANWELPRTDLVAALGQNN